jgi:hypothetical protein
MAAERGEKDPTSFGQDIYARYAVEAAREFGEQLPRWDQLSDFNQRQWVIIARIVSG